MTIRGMFRKLSPEAGTGTYHGLGADSLQTHISHEKLSKPKLINFLGKGVRGKSRATAFSSLRNGRRFPLLILLLKSKTTGSFTRLCLTVLSSKLIALGQDLKYTLQKANGQRLRRKQATCQTELPFKTQTELSSAYVERHEGVSCTPLVSQVAEVTSEPRSIPPMPQ